MAKGDKELFRENKKLLSYHFPSLVFSLWWPWQPASRFWYVKLKEGKIRQNNHLIKEFIQSKQGICRLHLAYD